MKEKDEILGDEISKALLSRGSVICPKNVIR